ncbi:MAG: transcription elongation factor Spt5 [Candidatus Aenigmatarchaeota archaeon]|jgi:transcriptional antiterminator NusG
MMWTIRTTVGRENAVIETLTNKIRNTGSSVYAVLHPDELKGYLFIEGETSGIEHAIQGVPHVRGLIRKEVKMGDIRKFLETRKVEIKVNRGDIIEITGGPFKNEKGKITRVDESKEEITVELLEAAIPIPVTVPISNIRLVQSAEAKLAEEKKQ